MARKIRYTPEGGALFEITCRTIHSRFLFRPTRRFNEILVGILARAKTRYGVEISAFCCLSNHFHILARVDDSRQLSRFMCYVCSKLARNRSSHRFNFRVVCREGAPGQPPLPRLASHPRSLRLDPQPEKAQNDPANS